MNDSARVQGRPNYFEIDLDAIAHNAARVRAMIGPGVKIFASVKANAYGFGLIEVADVLVDAGVDALAMVDLRDAVRLRQHRRATPLLVYGGNLVNRATIELVQQHNLILTVDDLESARACAWHATGRVVVYAEVDVGSERLGIPASQAGFALREIHSLPNLELRALYTHIHVPAGGALDPYVTWQFQRFRRIVQDLEPDRRQPVMAMAASSPVLLLSSHMNLDAVDVGRLLYGVLRPDVEPTLAALDLRPAFVALKSQLVHCKVIDRDEFYDAAPFAIRKDMRVGVVPMGYADGLAELACGVALVHGKRVKLLGTPGLEHTRLDLTDLPDAAPGDEVVFIGTQGAEEITTAEILARHGTEPPARIAVAVGETVQRVYVGPEEGKLNSTVTIRPMPRTSDPQATFDQANIVDRVRGSQSPLDGGRALESVPRGTSAGIILRRAAAALRRRR
jgi:alanine racemase